MPSVDGGNSLLAGHAPAVKVGGMRVVQHPHVSTAEKQPKEEKEKQEEEYSTDKPEEPQQVVGGVAAKGHKDFTPDAAKVAHDKPQPTKDKPPHKGPIGQPSIHLKQPSKQ